MLVQDNLDKIKLLLISGGEGNGHAGLYSQNIVGWWTIKPDVCTRDTPALIRHKDTASDNQSPLLGAFLAFRFVFMAPEVTGRVQPSE